MAKKETELSVLKDIRETLKTRLPVLKVTDIVSGSSILKTYLEAVNSSNRFEKLSDGWIKDNLLGIDWAPVALEKHTNWNEAEKYATQYGRQPTDYELSTLIDRSKSNPAIIEAAKVLELKTDDWYWSKVTCAWYPSSAWVVNFSYGGVSSYGKDYSFYVRPVRSSQ